MKNFARRFCSIAIILALSGNVEAIPFKTEIDATENLAFSSMIRYCIDQYHDQNYSDAYAFCSIYENSNDGRVNKILGDLYYNGYGVTKDQTLAIEHYRRAVILGEHSAAAKLAEIYLFDKSTPRNESMATYFLNDAIQNGVPQAFFVAVRYRYGLNNQDKSDVAVNDFLRLSELVEKNLPEDNEFYTMQALLLAHFHITGYGTERDIGRAIEVLTMLDNDYNDPHAQLELGKLYFYGNGVERDLDKACLYLEKITSENEIENFEHFYYLGLIFRQGTDDIPANEARAIDLLRRSALSGNELAAEELADIYFKRSSVAPNELREVYYWCDRIVALGNPRGLFLKASYMMTVDPKADTERYLLQSGESGICQAYDILGDRYYLKEEFDRADNYYYLAFICGKTERSGRRALIMLKGTPANFNYEYFSQFINDGINRNDSDAYYASGMYYLNPPDNQNNRNIETALADLERAGAMGNSEALYRLYELYISGKQVKISVPKAIDYLKVAAEFGSSAALHKLAVYSSNGNYMKKDLNLALQFAQKLTKQNPALGYYDLAKIYIEQKQYQKGIEFYKKSADEGNLKAFIELGRLYRDGVVVESDMFLACNYFYQALNKGSRDAENLLANCVYEIRNSDISESIPYLEKAAAKGNEEALEKLIAIYSNAEDGLHSNTEFLKWIGVGAKFGFPNSLYLYGSAYLHGIDDVLSINEEIGKKYLKLAISKGSAPAAFELAKYLADKGFNNESCDLYEKFSYSTDYGFMQNSALCYLNGIGRKFNPNHGEELLLKAYDMSHSAETAFLLGEMYSDKTISKFNLSKAAEWYLEAVDRGSISALERLGELYSSDSSMFDGNKSFFYYTKAMEEGSSSAYVKVANYYYNGIGTAVDYSMACDIAEEAVQQDISSANPLLAKCFLTGNGRTQNFDRAVALLHDGVEKNDAQSALMLGDIYSQGKSVDPDMDFACKYYYKAIIRDKYRDKITAEAIKYFLEGSICRRDSVHSYIIFNLLQNEKIDLGVKYHNEIARLVKILNDRELKFAHQIISEMHEYDEYDN